MKNVRIDPLARRELADGADFAICIDTAGYDASLELRKILNPAFDPDRRTKSSPPVLS